MSYEETSSTELQKINPPSPGKLRRRLRELDNAISMRNDQLNNHELNLDKCIRSNYEYLNKVDLEEKAEIEKVLNAKNEISFHGIFHRLPYHPYNESLRPSLVAST